MKFEPLQINYTKFILHFSNSSRVMKWLTRIYFSMMYWATMLEMQMDKLTTSEFRINSFIFFSIHDEDLINFIKLNYD